MLINKIDVVYNSIYNWVEEGTIIQTQDRNQ